MPATRPNGMLHHPLPIFSPTDILSSDVVPDSQKSTSQSMQDKASREKDSHKSGGNESVLDKAKDAVGMGDKKH